MIEFKGQMPWYIVQYKPAQWAIRQIMDRSRRAGIGRGPSRVPDPGDPALEPSPQGRTHSWQLGSTAAERLHPEFAGLGRDLFLAPACFISDSSRGHQCTHPETVKQIQQSEACYCMNILLTTHS